MSYELPFSRPTGWSSRKIILLGLIVAHSAWIVFHLNLVSRGLVDPWKLGGYGMYTTVHPQPKMLLLDRRYAGRLIADTEYKRRGFVAKNFLFVLRCRPIALASLQDLFDENPKLVGVPLRIVITEQRLLRNPIRHKRTAYSVLDLRWLGWSSFEYVGKVCDNSYNGKGALKS